MEIQTENVKYSNNDYSPRSKFIFAISSMLIFATGISIGIWVTRIPGISSTKYPDSIPVPSYSTHPITNIPQNAKYTPNDISITPFNKKTKTFVEISPMPPEGINDTKQNAFTDSANKLSLRYPLNYKAPVEDTYQSDSTCKYISIESPITNNKNNTITRNDLEIGIKLCPIKKNETLEKLVLENQSGTEQIFNSSKQIINGVTFTGWNWKNSYGGNGETFIAITNNESVIIYKYPLITKRQNEFNDILSSIAFLN